MASELKVDKFTGVTTADVISVTTGSTTTTLQLGIASHALHYNHQTPAIIKSWNTSSVTLVNITHSGGSTDGRHACNICGDLA